MNLKRILALSLILGAVLSAAYPDGGGGFFYGLQTNEYLPNNSLGLMYTGGYGYGVSGHEINGGFGVGLHRRELRRDVVQGAASSSPSDSPCERSACSRAFIAWRGRYGGWRPASRTS